VILLALPLDLFQTKHYYIIAKKQVKIILGGLGEGFMPTLDQYLSDDYPKIDAQLQEMKLCVAQCANLLRQSYQKTATVSFWPYSYPDFSPPTKFSVSTQAMCATAAQHLIEDGFDKAATPKLSALRDEVLNSTFAHILANVAAGKAAWKSSTFGVEDVFTTSWLVDVISKRRASVDIVKPALLIINDALQRAVEERFEQTLFQFDYPNDAGPHPLPLLRLFQSVTLIENSALIKKMPGISLPLVEEKMLSDAAHWFERNLHRQMSFYHFSDFRFDAAEMVFCLAGLLETKGIALYDDLIKQVLTIIQDAQERSVYWRPYRPMISTETGMTLLPLSIEVASTLLDLLDTTRNFDAYQDTLSKYYRWLLSVRIIESKKKAHDPSCWAGWHSENAYGPPGVHVWDTARVAMFLMEYSKAIRRQIQEDLRKKSGFTIKNPSQITLTLDRIVPYDQGATESFKDRIKRSISSESFSLLLYGPPGTSKTTLAQAIAKFKGWDMVYITPSDFISGGESAIEQKAKSMFEVLTKMSETVVFFDEIDRLLLDRDSDSYGQQEDIFQFMTPSMLAKLAELRKVQKLGFVIGTNYSERIDRAIKREGRIDKALLCAPPNKAARLLILKGFLEDGVAKAVWTSAHEKSLATIANRTVCYVYEELRSLVNSAIAASSPATLESILTRIKGALSKESSEVTVESYKKRLALKEYPQKPLEEYVALLMLSAEVRATNESSVVTMVKKLKKKYGDPIVDDLVPLAKSCHLGRVESAL
jgi:hypothetical protein